MVLQCITPILSTNVLIDKNPGYEMIEVQVPSFIFGYRMLRVRRKVFYVYASFEESPVLL